MCISYLCSFTKFTLAFRWGLCLFCRWKKKKKVCSCPHLVSSDLDRTLSVDPAGLVYRRRESGLGADSANWHGVVLYRWTRAVLPHRRGTERLPCEVVPMPNHLHKSIRDLMLYCSESIVRENKNVTGDSQTCLSSGKSFWWLGSAVMLCRL